MDLPRPFEEALSILYPPLSTAPAGAWLVWAITGSLGMVLQGMALEMHDIDLQTTDAGVEALVGLFAPYLETPAYERVSERMRSRFAVLRVAGMKVEVIGDLMKRDPGGEWQLAPDLAALRRWVEHKGMRLPVMDLEYEQRSYQAMGREAKAAAIRAFLDGKKRGEP